MSSRGHIRQSNTPAATITSNVQNNKNLMFYQYLICAAKMQGTAKQASKRVLSQVVGHDVLITKVAATLSEFKVYVGGKWF